MNSKRQCESLLYFLVHAILGVVFRHRRNSVGRAQIKGLFQMVLTLRDTILTYTYLNLQLFSYKRHNLHFLTYKVHQYIKNGVGD